ncbi:hypothetical protein FTX61_00300 [Nitriliruptoraceae bacterium ZYF776]|nr:hypothetical protein [Profundirhabdus halotolerans]
MTPPRPPAPTVVGAAVRPILRPLAVAALALTLGACGGGVTAVEVSPVRAPLEPSVVDTSVAPTAEPAAPGPEADAPGAPDADPAPSSPEVDTEPAPSDPPVSGPAPEVVPEVVVDADGCATDPVTGLVVACADPAAGPDPGSEEFCRVTPADPSCEPR